MQLIFDKGAVTRQGSDIPLCDVDAELNLPEQCLRSTDAEMPEVSELDVVRHYTALSNMNLGVDSCFYPLGSCTMKYNPKFCEVAAGIPGFAELHPLLLQLPKGNEMTQGALALLYETGQLLCEITGMTDFTLQPLAGAHGELTGLMLIAAYHKKKNNKKSEVIVPDSAHGTNPASASIAGFNVVTVPTGANGCMDMEKFQQALGEQTAGVMLTCPNTHGLFNSDVKRVSEMVHEVDGLMYYDGANLNAILGKTTPAKLGFDVVHLNLHKTFGTPHGGGGPGSGPVGVVEKLLPFLPVARVVKKDDGWYALEYDFPDSIGYIAPFYGNFLVILKAYVYILRLGRDGLTRVSENAVLNANYIMRRLSPYYNLSYDHTCMHECVLSASRQAKKGVSALDIAKGLIDRGFHPPSIYFPLTVKEAMMIEPTECESKETLDAFIGAMIDIAGTVDHDPDSLHHAPITTPVGRLDEVAAVRNLDLKA